MIGEADVAFYRENGYLVVPEVIGEIEIRRLRAAVDELVEAARPHSAHTEVYDLEDDHGPARPRVRRIKTPHRWNPAFTAMVAHEAILAVLKPLIGEGIRFDTSKLNLKDAGGGAAVEWHQDWAFYPHTNDDLCAVGIMIDDMDLENGALMVVPGSHTGPIYDHHVEGRFCGAINDEAALPLYERAVPITGPAGSISIHHVRAVHGSAPNHSSRPRRLLLHQYRAADAWPIALMPKDWESYEAQLLTGESSVVPRLEPVPVRLPFPPALHQGSIYENQRTTREAHFRAAGERQAV